MGKVDLGPLATDAVPQMVNEHLVNHIANQLA